MNISTQALRRLNAHMTRGELMDLSKDIAKSLGFSVYGEATLKIYQTLTTGREDS